MFRALNLLLIAAALACAQNIITVLPKQDRSATGELRFLDKQTTPHFVAFAAPDSVAANIVWKLPADNASGVLTNTAGVLSWAPAGAPSNMVTTDTDQTLTGIKTFPWATSFKLADSTNGWNVVSSNSAGSGGSDTSTVGFYDARLGEYRMTLYSKIAGVAYRVIGLGGSLFPFTDSVYDIGTTVGANARWRNLYINGTISGASNMVTTDTTQTISGSKTFALPLIVNQKVFGGESGILIKGLSPMSNWPNLAFSVQNQALADVIAASVYGQIINDATGAEAMDLIFGTASSGTLTERMRIESGGNVKITNSLRVGGTVYLLDMEHSIRAVGGQGVYIDTYGVTDPFFLEQSTGYLGLGTLDPAGRLHLEATNGNHIYLSNSTSQPWQISAYDDGTLRFNAAGIATRMMLDTAGDLTLLAGNLHETPGGLGSKGGRTPPGEDLNEARENGFWRVVDTSLNRPTGAVTYGAVITADGGANIRSQIYLNAQPDQPPAMWLRVSDTWSDDNLWEPWAKVAMSSDMSNMVTTDTIQDITGVKTFKAATALKLVDATAGWEIVSSNAAGTGGSDHSLVGFRDARLGEYRMTLYSKIAGAEYKVIGFGGSLFPFTDGVYDIGTTTGSNARWRNLSISGTISGATNMVTTDTVQTITGGKTFDSAAFIHELEIRGSQSTYAPFVRFHRPAEEFGQIRYGTDTTHDNVFYFRQINAAAPASIDAANIAAAGWMSITGAVKLWDATNGWNIYTDNAAGSGGSDNSFFSIYDARTATYRATFYSKIAGAAYPVVALNAHLYPMTDATYDIGTITGSARKWRDLFLSGTAHVAGLQVGTSTTSGYVLTADSSGNGTWQVVPSGGVTSLAANSPISVSGSTGAVTISCSTCLTTSSNYVTTNTTQSLSGQKTFSSGTTYFYGISMSGTLTGATNLVDIGTIQTITAGKIFSGTIQADGGIYTTLANVFATGHNTYSGGSWRYGLSAQTINVTGSGGSPCSITVYGGVVTATTCP